MWEVFLILKCTVKAKQLTEFQTNCRALFTRNYCVRSVSVQRPLPYPVTSRTHPCCQKQDSSQESNGLACKTMGTAQGICSSLPHMGCFIRICVVLVQSVCRCAGYLVPSPAVQKMPCLICVQVAAPAGSAVCPCGNLCSDQSLWTSGLRWRNPWQHQMV